MARFPIPITVCDFQVCDRPVIGIWLERLQPSSFATYERWMASTQFAGPVPVMLADMARGFQLVYTGSNYLDQACLLLRVMIVVAQAIINL